MEINGIKYKKREVTPPSKSLKRFIAVASLFGGINLPNNNIQGIDIVKEFKLIQEKKSKLSRAQRDSVVYQFNRLYEKE